MPRTKWICNISQKCPWGNTPISKFNLSINHIADRNWLLNSRLPTSDPPTPGPHRENCPQVAPGQNGRVEHPTKREASGSIHDSATTRIVDQRIYPAQKSRFKSDNSWASRYEVLQNSMLDALCGEYDRGLGSATIYTTGDPNTGQNKYSEQNPNSPRIPDSGSHDENYSKNYSNQDDNWIIVVIWYFLAPLREKAPKFWPPLQTRRELNLYRSVELLLRYSVWEQCSRPG